MATVWIRHPRYSLLILVTLITTFYLLSVPHERPIQSFHIQDDSLKTRVQRSHTIYDKFLVQREGLLKKWGPTKDIAMYVVLSLSLNPFLNSCAGFLLTSHLGLLTLFVSCKFFPIFTADTCQGISFPPHSTAHMRWSVSVLWGTAGSGSAVFHV